MGKLIFRSLMAITCGLVVGGVLLMIGAPSWVCAIGSGLTSGIATHFLLSYVRR